MNAYEQKENSPITMSNGIFLTLKRSDDFYLVQGGKRHHLPYATWGKLFKNEEKIRIKTKSKLDSIPLGTPMSADTCLIKSKRTDSVYLYSNGIKRYIRNPHDFELAGFSWEKINDGFEESTIDQMRSARDFVIETTKEMAIDNKELPSDFSRYPKYGILKRFSYQGDNETKKEGCILLPEDVSNSKLPVLYLLHGKGRNKEWEDVGQIQHIMGFMIKMKMIPDMVIVMPYIMSSDYDSDEKKVHDFHYFNKDLVHLMEYVGTNYAERISTCKEDTAIAGISMGGTTALYNGCLFKDRFSYVGGISPNYHLIKCHERMVHDGWLEKEENFVLGTSEGGFAYITIGDRDFDYKNHAKYYSNVLNKNGIDNLFGYLPDETHNWNAFRKLFYHFMSYDFFRKKAE